MISGLFVYNHKGDTIISRIYRDDITKASQDAFRANIIHSRSTKHSPINTIGKQSFLHIYCNELWIVAVSVANCNATMVFEFLNKFMALCCAYPTFSKFDEMNVKDNFVLIYELLDEILDNGYPQSTDPDALKIITEDAAKKGASLDSIKQIASQVTGQIGWRREGIKYRKNEMYIDVVEKVNCLVASSTGNTLHANVAGAIKMKSLLSGMPECKFGINDKLVAGKKDKKKDSKKKKGSTPIAIDDLTFHQCVRLGTFDTNRQITFVPPDGEFELMKYRTTTDVLLPFKVTPMLQEQGNTISITVVVKAEFEEKHMASKLELKIPVPTSAKGVTLVRKTGKAKYATGSNEVIWRMKDFRGKKSATLEIKIELLQTVKKKPWAKPPISLFFEVPFACSGLTVNYVLVSEPREGYDHDKVMKWVRYLASSGLYETRY
eukprot:m.258667 g.258667  ORF g.258667 m.258667 type:complete len:435 (+) comp36862_c0_seq1:213-1517(+)